MAKINKKLIFIQFNEINFKLLTKYTEKYNFVNLKKILKLNSINTNSEKKYELLEPWIQWLTIYTGKSADDHKIFRLGDVKNLKNTKLIFDKIEEIGLNVGCIAPMNAINNLKNPSYFISDPWTNTNNDNSYWSSKISKLISKLVNNNSSGKISLKDIFSLILIIIRFTRISKYLFLFSLIIKSKNKKWYRALLLDFILHEVHLNYFKLKKPDLSTIFFNAGAHIQHHYLFFSEFNNSKLKDSLPWYLSKNSDPLFDSMKFYDNIFKDYFELNDIDILIATGLSQTTLDELIFYYRLKDHNKFINNLNIRYLNIQPRMSRDFLINFTNETDAKLAEKIFKESYEISTNLKIFEEVDNRGKSLFITLTYHREIKKNMKIKINNQIVDFFSEVNFVAIKNGLHNGNGYLYHQDNFQINSQKSEINIKEIFNHIENYFGDKVNDN